MGTTQVSRSQTAITLENFCKSPLLSHVLKQSNSSCSSKKKKKRLSNGANKKETRGKYDKQQQHPSKYASVPSIPTISLSSSHSSTITPHFSDGGNNNDNGVHLPKRSITDRVLSERPGRISAAIRRPSTVGGRDRSAGKALDPSNQKKRQ